MKESAGRFQPFSVISLVQNTSKADPVTVSPLSRCELMCLGEAE